MPRTAKERRHEQVEQTRIHRCRHGRGRRIPARRRRLHLRARPSLARARRMRPRRDSSRPGSPINPDNITTILDSALRDGTGHADRAGDDGGRGTGRGLVARSRRRRHQRSMRTRTATSSAPPAATTCRPSSVEASTTAATKWPSGSVSMVTGGSTAVRGTGEYGMRVAGAAAKEMLIAAAAKQWGVSAIGVRGEELARRARSIGSQRDLWRAGAQRGVAARADQSDARRIPTASRSVGHR